MAYPLAPSDVLPSCSFAVPSPLPLEGDIRAYAYHLYEDSNHRQGRDLQNWFEAAACLRANIPIWACHDEAHPYRHDRVDADAALACL